MSVQTNTPPLLRGLIGITCVIVIFAAIYFSRAVANPVFIGIFIALLLAPVYQWLQGKMSKGLALIATLVAIVLLFALLGVLFALSAQRLRTGMETYASGLKEGLDQLLAGLQSTGLTTDASTISTEGMTLFVNIVANALDVVVTYIIPVTLITIFLLSEGESLWRRAQQSLPNNLVIMRLSTFGGSVARQFGIRAIVNAITGSGFAILLLLMGVDYAVLWGVLTFFLSYIPYIGIVVAGTPAVILAFAEFGLGRALLVVVALTAVNFAAENVLSPSLMGRGLNLSTTVTFVGFMFWFWLLGGAGAFLAMPLTILVILLLGCFPATQWLANIAMRSSQQEPPSEANASQ
jgi:predicted PurR-regulated permease PerM